MKTENTKDPATDQAASSDSSDEYYEVERILDEKDQDGQMCYKIRWVNYGPEFDSLEPVSAIAHCHDIIAQWEREKEARAAKLTQQNRKRSRSVQSGDDLRSATGSASGRRRKKSKTVKSKSPSKRQKEVDDDNDDDESEASKGTHDSYMDELKSKNEGTYRWRDVRPAQLSSDSDAEGDSEYASLKEQERQRRKSKRKLVTPTTKDTKTPTAAKKNPPPKPKSSTNSPIAPHFPFGSRSMNSIKPARRKTGEAVNSLQPDERRQKLLNMSYRNNIKRKQRQEPPPDASAIAVFRPDAVLTSGARSMKSGRGYEKAVGDIDTAISISQSATSAPLSADSVEPKSAITEKSAESPTPRRRRSSVSDAISQALKFRDENKPEAVDVSPVIQSPVSPVNTFSETVAEGTGTQALAEARLKNAHAPMLSPTRRASYSAESSRPPQRPPPLRSDSTGNVNVPLRIIAASDTFQTPEIDILPTLSEDDSRTWTGELLYSKERSSLGQIRLLIPQSSIRIKQLPKLGSSICLSKMLSVEYLSRKWFSKTAHPSKKPECLLVEFESKEAQKRIVDALRNTDSAGLVCEETFTLLFFFKHNDRLRMLFNGDASSGPIGVALLDGVNIEATEFPVSEADELLNHRRMPYVGILLSDSLNSYIPHLRDLPYVMHSPPDSAETSEMEVILATRGAIPAPERHLAGLVLIHRSLLPCLNYIPDLTEHKRRPVDILLFGSYLDYELEDGNAKPVFGCGVSKIFPNAGLICFTVEHLLENPWHITSILAYNKSRPSWNIVLPSNMVDKFELLEAKALRSPEDVGDILVALALLQDQIATKDVLVEDYKLDEFGVHSFLPFMNFLQNKNYGSIRRFLLIHPTPVSGSEWTGGGNGIEVYTAEEFGKHFKPK